jgi:tRNA dimethylallyltransferase
MYREMKIGTATPSTGQLAAVPHYFIGNLSVADYYSVFRFEQDALALLDRLFRDHQLVIMTGGSGLYMDAVISGIDDIPDPDPEIRRNLKIVYETGGLEPILRQLETLDPDFYRKVDRQNPSRVIRGLEVCLTTGRPFSSFHRRSARPRNFDVTMVGLELPRNELYKRIEDRVDLMIQQGLVEEAGELFDLRHLNALNTVGYKEIFEYLDGTRSLDEAIRLIKRNSRRYAKRQMSWNNRYKDLNRFHPSDIEGIIRFIEGFGNPPDKIP